MLSMDRKCHEECCNRAVKRLFAYIQESRSFENWYQSMSSLSSLLEMLHGASNSVEKMGRLSSICIAEECFSCRFSLAVKSPRQASVKLLFADAVQEYCSERLCQQLVQRNIVDSGISFESEARPSENKSAAQKRKRARKRLLKKRRNDLTSKRYYREKYDHLMKELRQYMHAKKCARNIIVAYCLNTIIDQALRQIRVPRKPSKKLKKISAATNYKLKVPDTRDDKVYHDRELREPSEEVTASSNRSFEIHAISQAASNADNHSCQSMESFPRFLRNNPIHDKNSNRADKCIFETENGHKTSESSSMSTPSVKKKHSDTISYDCDQFLAKEWHLPSLLDSNSSMRALPSCTQSTVSSFDWDFRTWQTCRTDTTVGQDIENRSDAFLYPSAGTCLSNDRYTKGLTLANLSSIYNAMTDFEDSEILHRPPETLHSPETAGSTSISAKASPATSWIAKVDAVEEETTYLHHKSSTSCRQLNAENAMMEERLIEITSNVVCSMDTLEQRLEEKAKVLPESSSRYVH